MNLERSYKLYKLGVVVNPVLVEIFVDIEKDYYGLVPVVEDLYCFLYKDRRGEIFLEYLTRLEHLTLYYRKEWEYNLAGIGVNGRDFADFMKVEISEIYDIKILGITLKERTFVS